MIIDLPADIKSVASYLIEKVNLEISKAVAITQM